MHIGTHVEQVVSVTTISPRQSAVCCHLAINGMITHIPLLIYSESFVTSPVILLQSYTQTAETIADRLSLEQFTLLQDFNKHTP